MSGAGKWIKKHPAESVAALAILGTGGAGLAGLGPMAGLLGAGEAAGATAAGAVAGDAFLPAALGAGAEFGGHGAAIAAGDAFLPGAIGAGEAASYTGANAVAGDAFMPGMFGSGSEYGGMGEAVAAGDAYMPSMLAPNVNPMSASDGLLATRTATPNLLDYASALGAKSSKAEPYLKLAQMGMSLNERPQVAPPRAPQLRGAGQPIAYTPMYVDPEEEKRKQYGAWLAQQQQGRGYYG